MLQVSISDKPSTSADSQDEPTDELAQKVHITKLFKNFDTNNDGVLDTTELKNLFENHPEDISNVSKNMEDKFLKVYDGNKDGKLDTEEFERLLQKHQWMTRMQSFVAPTQSKRKIEDEMKICPPPLGILIITIAQIVFFILHRSESTNKTFNIASNSSGLTGFTKQDLHFSPQQRGQLWRFLSYMFVHDDAFHIVANLFIQVLLGIPLEYAHSSWRVMIVYLAGVLGGSLGTSVLRPKILLIGSSAGGYALLTACVSNFILNWNQMKNRILYLMMFTVLLIFITLPTIVNHNEKVSHVAHICGAIAGLLAGLVVLKNFEVETFERKVKRCASLVFIAMVLIAIFINLFHPSHFDDK